MQERNPNDTIGGPLGIRISVWIIICGLLLMCVLLLTISRRHASSSAVETTSTSEDAARHDLPPTPNRVRPIYRATPRQAVFETDTQSTSPRASAGISNELSIAREKLTELRGSYSDEHPDVKEQLRAIESLERSELMPGETLELAKGRADLAKLEVRLGPQHPDLQAQRLFVESLEQSARASEPSDLAQAKAQLARLRVHYGDGHPDVQAQLRKVAELQR